jgi:hypothetical protein
MVEDTRLVDEPRGRDLSRNHKAQSSSGAKARNHNNIRRKACRAQETSRKQNVEPSLLNERGGRPAAMHEERDAGQGHGPDPKRNGACRQRTTNNTCKLGIDSELKRQ